MRIRYRVNGVLDSQVGKKRSEWMDGIIVLAIGKNGNDCDQSEWVRFSKVCVKTFSFILKIAYGLTELSPACCITAIDDPIDIRVSTVGKMLPNTEVGTRKPMLGVIKGKDEH